MQQKNGVGMAEAPKDLGGRGWRRGILSFVKSYDVYFHVNIIV